MRENILENDLLLLLEKGLPLKVAPLVHCITNEVTCETVANALLYLDAKPLMAADPREFSQLFQQTNSLVLNLGHLSPVREVAILAASLLAAETRKPTVVDLVGVAASSIRFELAQELLQKQPTVIKGNTSEMRAFCGLKNDGRGVDGGPKDQSQPALVELTKALQNLAKRQPKTTFLATGATDLLVNREMTITLNNGVADLARFTGSGDVVGALIAAFLGGGQSPVASCLLAVSYFNLCGERAKSELNGRQGLAAFRQQTLNQLSLLQMETDWYQRVKGWRL